MISVQKLSYSIPEKYLYQDATFTIEDGQHCVLIGSNGSGKTTLIDLLLHPDDYVFQGKVLSRGIARIGYVNQFIEHEKDRALSVFAYLCEDFETMQSEMDTLCGELETAEDSDAAMERYQRSLDAFMAVDGYQYEVNIRKQLKTAGLERLEETPLSAISGGEYKLVQIIRQMLKLPDLLVMDEPDVFLDFENLSSLRALINAHEGTMLVATHNRYLLNHCFDKILQIENQSIQAFEGSYMDFCFTQLQLKIAMQETSIKEAEYIQFQEAVVERMRDDASKHISLRKGKILHARVSYVEHWKARHIEGPYLQEHTPKIHFPALAEETELPEYAIKVTEYKVTFDAPLLEHVSFTIAPGEKVALVGPNGTGKTTLLRDIWQQKDPAISVHPAMRLDFLSQFHGETLFEEQSVWELMDSLGFPNRDAAASFLADYCFEPDILDHRVRTLSGGEKNLLQLARLAAGNGSCLLLDEPTSHLDLPAQAALEQAVSHYSGTVLMVSHDFYSIAGCVDYVLFTEHHTIRKMSLRAFRKMIYKRHFPLSYLELEQKKRELETQITSLLKASNYEEAKKLCAALDGVIGQMQAL